MTQIVPIVGPFAPNSGPGRPPDVPVRRRRRVPRPTMSPLPPARPPRVIVGSPPAAPPGSAAGAAPRSPYPPILSPLTDPALQSLADERVNAELQAESLPIIRAKQEAARRALGANAATIGFTKAAQDMLGQVGAPDAEAYSSGADSLRGLGLPDGAQNFANFSADAMQAGADSSQTWAGQLGQIQGNQGQEILGGLMYDAQQQEHDFEQQLIDLAAKRPDLRNQIMDSLWQREMDKLNARLGIDKAGADAKQQAFENTMTLRDARLKERAQGDIEQQLGETHRSNVAGEQITAANNLLDYKAANASIAERYQVAVAKAEQSGRQIDAAASRVRGFVIDKQGRFVLGDNGQRIPVKQTTRATTTAFQKATRNARSLRGNAVAVSDTSNPWSPGKYIAAEGARGVIVKTAPDGTVYRTTNDPKKAKRDGTMTFVEAQGYLMSAYGLSRAQARKALVAAGWKPDGVRPRPVTGPPVGPPLSPFGVGL